MWGRAVRIVTNSGYDAPADALMKRLNWPNIAEIIKRETATIVYRSLNGLEPTYLSDIISKNSSLGTVKLKNSEYDLRIPLFKTSNGQKSFSYRGLNVLSSLEPEVKQAPCKACISPAILRALCMLEEYPVKNR